MSTAQRTYHRGASLITLKQGLAQDRRTYHFGHQGTTRDMYESLGISGSRLEVRFAYVWRHLILDFGRETEPAICYDHC